MKSNFSVAPVEYSQIANGTSISAPQQVVNEISDSACVTGRRGISAEYRPNDTSELANIRSPRLKLMLASAPKSPRRMMVSTPASEMVMPASCAPVRRMPNSASDHSATNSGPADWINRAFSASVYCRAQYEIALLKANPTSDRNSIIGRWARSTGQSCFRCGQANGSRIRKVLNQRTQDSVKGGTWPATWRASTMLPAQNREVRVSNR